MSKITFILGGARSSKSSFAVNLAKDLGEKVAFIATCMPFDKELKRRIKIHKKSRPSSWKTFQEPKDIISLFEKINRNFEVIIIDCLTIFISNLLLEGYKDKYIEDKIKKLLEVIKKAKSKTIIVSNEVGLGIVPENQLARRFRDLSGRINQMVAESSDVVYLLFSGIPLKIKNEKD